MAGHPRVLDTLLLATILSLMLFALGAFTVQSYAQQHLAPAYTALILTLEPVFAWLTAALVVHEHFGRRTLAGALLILAGIAAIELLPAISPTPTPI
jgi:drug/metabolite transporter (DMT)-like permease